MVWRWIIHYRELIQLRERVEKHNDLKNEMASTFEAVAQQALQGSNQEFLKIAELAFSKQRQEASFDLEKRKVEIDNLVSPLKETLGNFKKEVSQMETERQRSYALVESELKKVIENNTLLSKETRALKDALKKPHIRGRWGEVQLKNCVELAGMSEYSDVVFQDVNVDSGKTLIPDMTVKMPGGRSVIVDAKTPLDAFLESLEATTDEKRQEQMARHGRQIKDHVKKLSQKSYGEMIKDSADFTVMFLPNESFLYAALETQPDIVEYALEKKFS